MHSWLFYTRRAVLQCQKVLSKAIQVNGVNKFSSKNRVSSQVSIRRAYSLNVTNDRCKEFYFLVIQRLFASFDKMKPTLNSLLSLQP